MARKAGKRQLGTLRGTVTYIAPDFDAPLDDFKEYMHLAANEEIFDRYGIKRLW